LDVLSDILMAAPSGILKESEGSRRSRPERVRDPGFNDDRGRSSVSAPIMIPGRMPDPGLKFSGGPRPPTDRLSLPKDRPEYAVYQDSLARGQTRILR